LFLLQRNEIELQQAQKEKDAEKQQQKSLKQQKRQKILESPLAKLCASLGNAAWVIAVSFILTLSASYLASNPQTFDSLLRSVERHLSINLAGAAELSTREVSIQVEREMNAGYIDDRDKIIELLGTTRSHSIAGYAGTLTLQRVEVTPQIGVLSGRADRVAEFDQLPSNDVLQLPTSQDFNLRCDRVFGAERQVTLTAAEWSWEVQESDSFGLPKTYKAQVIYRGEERWLGHTSLRITAHYSGQVFGAPLETTQQRSPNPTTLAPSLEAPTEESDNIEDIEFVVNDAVTENTNDFRDTPEQNELAERTTPEERSVPWLQIALGSLATSTLAGATAAVIYYRRRKKKQQSLL